MSEDRDNTTASASQPRRRSGHMWPAIRALLRTRIVAGLLIVIPIWVTWVVVKFIFDTMRSATEPLAKEVAHMVIRANKELVPEKVLGVLEWGVPALAVLLTLSLLYFLGLLGASVVGRRIIEAVEQFFNRLPLVKNIYRSTKQIVETFAGKQAVGFKRVVLIEFPRPGQKCIGFLTSVMKDADTGRLMAAVFIATTPNPTTGYMQFTPLEEVSELDWSIEEAIKVLISGGILSPATITFDRIHPVRAETVRELLDSSAQRGDKDKTPQTMSTKGHQL